MKLVFLGKLGDLAAGGECELEAEAPLGWASLLAHLDRDLAEALERETVRVAQNGVLLADRHTLIAAPGDEIAFLPPVSGG